MTQTKRSFSASEVCTVRKLFVRDGQRHTEQEITVFTDGSCRIVRPVEVWGAERARDDIVPLPEPILAAVKREVAGNGFFVSEDGVPVLSYGGSDWRILFSFEDGLKHLDSLMTSQPATHSSRSS